MSLSKTMKRILDDDRILPMILIVNLFLISHPLLHYYISAYTMIPITVYSVIVTVYYFLTRKNYLVHPITTLTVCFTIVCFLALFINKEPAVDNYSVLAMMFLNFFSVGASRSDLNENTRTKHFIQISLLYCVLATIFSIVSLGSVLFVGNYSLPNGNIYEVGFSGNGKNLIGFTGYLPLGNFTALAVLMGLFILFSQESSKVKIWTACMMAINGFVLFLSNCRSITVGLLAALLLLFLFYSHFRFKRKNFIIASCVAIFIVLLALFGIVVLKRGHDISSLLSQESLYGVLNRISSGRLPIYEAAIEVGCSSLFGGSSVDLVNASFNSYGTATHAHNIFLQIFASYGIFALCLFLAIIFIVSLYSVRYYLLCKSKGIFPWTFLIALITSFGLLVQGLFDRFLLFVGYSSPNIVFLITTGYVFYCISLEDCKRKKQN